MIRLSVEVELASPLHIGSETRQNSDAARPLMKDKHGLPYIPATSIKGRLRHEVEKLLQATGSTVCAAPTPQLMCQPVDGVSFCPVCQLFGAPWRESPLRFSELVLQTKGDARPANTQSRFGIRVGRVRRVVQDKFLFGTELYEPGIPWRFTGHIVYSGNNLSDLAPLLLAAKAVTSMGSSRSRGLGWCSVTIVPEEAIDLSALWSEWRENHV